MPGLRRNAGWWTCDDEHGSPLYYFAPENRKPGPYRKQITVEAIIDIADDGTLAGVELINNMPPQPK